MIDPKLLTEAEARDLGRMGENERLALLCERGLIAPEPVAPLLIEAREIAANARQSNYATVNAHLQDNIALKISRGEWDDHMLVAAALAALRRGMELRPTLTREMVRDAVASLGRYIDCMPPHEIAARIHLHLVERLS